MIDSEAIFSDFKV